MFAGLPEVNLNIDLFSIGRWGVVREVWARAAHKLLAKDKSAESERRHEAQVQDLTRLRLEPQRMEEGWMASLLRRVLDIVNSSS